MLLHVLLVRSLDGNLVLRFDVANTFLVDMKTKSMWSSKTGAQGFHVHLRLVSSMADLIIMFRLFGIINTITVFNLALRSLTYHLFSHLLIEINTLLQALRITRYLDFIDIQR
jgi:hypothetical protein